MGEHIIKILKIVVAAYNKIVPYQDICPYPGVAGVRGELGELIGRGAIDLFIELT